MGGSPVGHGALGVVLTNDETPAFPEGVLKDTGEVRLSRIIDVDVVNAHLKSGADYLATRDSDLLSARGRLAELGIRVVTPAEALELVGRNAGRSSSDEESEN